MPQTTAAVAGIGLAAVGQGSIMDIDDLDASRQQSLTRPLLSAARLFRTD